MKKIALLAIRFYQRCISPIKGYRCAYAVHSGRASCSGLGYRAIRRYGLWRGLGVLDSRLEQCGIAYRRHAPSQLTRQAGECDGGDCDVGDCDFADCDVGDCDRKRRRRKKAY
jgi:putative component of membrane protein insertase Oxa1/YidC/SpoIIIJ protein YidD